jgi:hypothetical protein
LSDRAVVGMNWISPVALLTLFRTFGVKRSPVSKAMAAIK